MYIDPPEEILAYKAMLLLGMFVMFGLNQNYAVFQYLSTCSVAISFSKWNFSITLEMAYSLVLSNS